MSLEESINKLTASLDTLIELLESKGVASDEPKEKRPRKKKEEVETVAAETVVAEAKTVVMPEVQKEEFVDAEVVKPTKTEVTQEDVSSLARELIAKMKGDSTAAKNIITSQGVNKVSEMDANQLQTAYNLLQEALKG